MGGSSAARGAKAGIRIRPPLSRSAKIATLMLVLTLALVGLSLLIVTLSDKGLPSELAGMSKAQLEQEKLVQEIRNLESERSLLRVLPSYAAIGTAIGAILGFLGTIRGQRRERESATIRRFDENFNTVMTNLGSESLAVQASAAVSLMTFLRPEYREFHTQVFLVTLANLKIPNDPEINRLLVRTFGAVFRLLGREGATGGAELDLSRAKLDRVDLEGCDLSEADVAFATMKHAVLRGTDLTRAKGYKVSLEDALLSDANLREADFNEALCNDAYFHNARMGGCWLEGADLRDARFQGAKLQSAHLDKANLSGARFEGADLNDTYFCDATLDDASLRSIARADNWRKAHFDDPTRSRLATLVGEEPEGRCPQPRTTQAPPADIKGNAKGAQE